MEINELGRPGIIAIDTPRAVSMGRAELYTMLECIKDGSFTSTKYQPANVNLVLHPHVFVFSNNELDVGSMSPDKFNCFIINSDSELKKNEVLTEKLMEEANKQRKAQEDLEKGVATELEDDLGSYFEACYEIDPDGPNDDPQQGNRILVHKMLSVVKETVPPDRILMLPALGGRESFGLWLKAWLKAWLEKKNVPKENIQKKHGRVGDGCGSYYIGMRRKQTDGAEDAEAAGAQAE